MTFFSFPSQNLMKILFTGYSLSTSCSRSTHLSLATVKNRKSGSLIGRGLHSHYNHNSTHEHCQRSELPSPSLKSIPRLNTESYRWNTTTQTTRLPKLDLYLQLFILIAMSLQHEEWFTALDYLVSYLHSLPRVFFPVCTNHIILL